MQHLKTRRAFFLSLTALCAVSTFAAPPLDLNHPSVRSVIAHQNKVTPGLMKTPAVLGTAVGADAKGNAQLIVFVEAGHPAAGKVNAPAGSQIVLTEKFRAGGPKPTSAPNSVNTTAKQSTPIALGTSGGWSYDLANGYCCGGTLGSLVSAGGNQYILSNWHVMESDIVDGGNSRQAGAGDAVIQPGLIDVGCSVDGAQTVGTLVPLKSLVDGRNVDVGVAQVVAGQVRSDGAILGIGGISATTIGTPAINQQVKKTGRTSGLTKSKISGLNATISVTYENECAGGTAFTRTFTGQIVVAKGATFLKAGDSGSLMVEDADIKPRAIGLLYAGSSQVAIANPINEVLDFVGEKLNGGVRASMVGQ
jgi:hypothetical protein